MTADHDALLAAVCANPQEDTPRLVYADWLDENADDFADPAVMRARAAFIRTDVAMCGREEWDADRVNWLRWAKRPLETQAWPTAPPLPEHCHWSRPPLYRRGFPWWVHVVPGWRTLPNVPSSLTPVERVAFSDLSTPAIRDVTESGWLGGVREFEFGRCRLTPSDLRRLTESPALTGAEFLDIGDGVITSNGVRVLCESAVFPRLTELYVGDVLRGRGLAAAVARVTVPTRLKRLRLSNLRLEGSDLAAFVGAPAVSGLESFAFYGRPGSNPGIIEATASAPLRHLRRLVVTQVPLAPEAVRMLAGACFLAQLRHLSLVSCNLTADSARELASGFGLAGLRVLDLESNLLGDDGVAAVLGSPRLAGLKMIDLGQCRAGNAAIRVLLDSPLADGLNFLDLTGSVASEGMKASVRSHMGNRVRI